MTVRSHPDSRTDSSPSSRATSARKLNICLVSEEYPPDTGWGGIGTYALNLAHGLVRLGHRVHVIAQGWEEDTFQVVEGVQLHRLVVPEPSWRRGTYFFNMRFYELRHILAWNTRVSRLVRQIEAAEKIDIIESPEFHAQCLLGSYQRGRAGLVVKLHTPAYLCRMINRTAVGGSRMDTWISEGLERVLAKRARMITSPSRKLVEDVAARWKLDSRAVRVIPNPIDDEMFGAGSAVGAENDALLFVGRIERRKGVESLAAAMPEILRSHPDARLQMVGNDHPSGPDGCSMTAHLRKVLDGAGVAEDAVKFTGPVDRSQLQQIYRSAGICVVPSLYENFPYTCLEAMAAGCAVVGAEVGGIPEIITNETDGLLVPPNCPDKLSQAIVRLLSDPELRMKLGTRAKETVRRRFGRDAVCEQTIEAYRTILA